MLTSLEAMEGCRLLMEALEETLLTLSSEEAKLELPCVAQLVASQGSNITNKTSLMFFILRPLIQLITAIDARDVLKGRTLFPIRFFLQRIPGGFAACEDDLGQSLAAIEGGLYLLNARRKRD